MGSLKTNLVRVALDALAEDGVDVERCHLGIETIRECPGLQYSV